MAHGDRKGTKRGDGGEKFGCEGSRRRREGGQREGEEERQTKGHSPDSLTLARRTVRNSETEGAGDVYYIEKESA